MIASVGYNLRDFGNLCQIPAISGICLILRNHWHILKEAIKGGTT